MKNFKRRILSSAGGVAYAALAVVFPARLSAVSVIFLIF